MALRKSKGKGRSSGTSVTVVYDYFPKIIQNLEARAAAYVAKAAMDIEAHAKTRAPVDTGFLANSIQAVRNNPLSWTVTVGADYGIYVEYGTVRMGAQPYWRPAIEQVRPAFLAAMKGVVAL